MAIIGSLLISLTSTLKQIGCPEGQPISLTSDISISESLQYELRMRC